MVSKAAGFGYAIAKGVEGYTAGKADRDAAKLRKAEGEAKLAKLRHAETTGAVNTEIDAVTAQNKELIRQNQQQQTFRSLDAYTADYDPRHLNNLIKHPMMQNKFKDLVSIDRVDPFNDINLIRRTGFNPEVFTAEATKKNASGRYVKATTQDGRKKILDMLTIYAGTGYTKYLANQDLEALLKRAKISKAIGVGKPGPLERDAAVIAAAEERIKTAEAGGKEPDPKDVQISRLGDKMKGGVKIGQLTEAEDRTTQLIKKFGGEDKFFETDFGDRKNYLKAYSDIAAIERLENVKYSSKDKTDLGNIRALISMGDPGADLTESETGIIDTMFLKAKKYVSDEVGGVAARSAYAAFRNTVRHALFGSALTEAEIKSFQETFGGLGQKLGPVLAQFKTALIQVQAKLESIARMSNPYSAHVRLGVDAQKLDEILTSIDQRIETMDELDVGNKVEVKDADLSGLGGTK